ncbi:MAG: mannitol-1-phosphate 5-dehydrogenase [Rhodoluna sp.]
MIAVHFGAGNIGRGFIGQLLHEAGYRLIFLDVNDETVTALKNAESYQVLETGSGAKTHRIDNFTAFNSQTEFDAAADAIASADLLTASVGVSVLKFLAPLIAAGLGKRTSAKPLIVMACENAIRATDTLKSEILAIDSSLAAKARFANTAVDRIVPPQKSGLGLDVLVEAFSEWVIDTSTLDDLTPTIPGAHFVEDLDPYIERKLFTVNTGHATLAYVGQQHGLETIVQSISNPAVKDVMVRALGETSEVLVQRHGFSAPEHKKYVDKTIDRFTNPDLDDPVTRVGREPARKLARHDRLVGPAAYLAEQGKEPVALLEAIDAALVFHDAGDEGVEKLQKQLKDLSAKEFVSAVMGLEADHPLTAKLTSHVEMVKQKNYS